MVRVRLSNEERRERMRVWRLETHSIAKRFRRPATLVGRMRSIRVFIAESVVERVKWSMKIPHY